MAETCEESTSFRQFDYCPLCRVNHKKKKKHIYSKRHQEILNNIIVKFGKKISDAKSCAVDPVALNLSTETDAKFWCYFCAAELDRHLRLDHCVIRWGGLIEHIASAEHSKKTDAFFWTNIMDKKLKEKFLLSEADLKLFRLSAELSSRKYLQERQTDKIKTAEEIKHAESQRWNFYQWQLQKSQSLKQNSKQAQRDGPRTQGSVPKRKKTLARAAGLTSVSHTPGDDDDDDEGNVFTGATPPWLLTDDQDKTKTSSDIGPSMQEYHKYLEREQKKNLPPNRVGAKFDHKSPASAQWLPSFGRVWNYGRRLQSRQQFEREIKKNKPQASVSSSWSLKSGTTAAEFDPSRPERSPAWQQQVTVAPYKRKRTTEPSQLIPPDFPVTAYSLIPSTSTGSNSSHSQDSSQSYQNYGSFFQGYNNSQNYVTFPQHNNISQGYTKKLTVSGNAEIGGKQSRDPELYGSASVLLETPVLGASKICSDSRQSVRMDYDYTADLDKR